MVMGKTEQDLRKAQQKDLQEAVEQCIERLGTTLFARILEVALCTVYTWRGEKPLPPMAEHERRIRQLAASLDETELPLRVGWKLKLLRLTPHRSEPVLVDPQGHAYGACDLAWKDPGGGADWPAWEAAKGMSIAEDCEFHALVGRIVALGRGKTTRPMSRAALLRARDKEEAKAKAST
jgi:hypothetical protein